MGIHLSGKFQSVEVGEELTMSSSLSKKLCLKLFCSADGDPLVFQCLAVSRFIFSHDAQLIIMQFDMMLAVQSEHPDST